CVMPETFYDRSIVCRHAGVTLSPITTRGLTHDRPRIKYEGFASVTSQLRGRGQSGQSGTDYRHIIMAADLIDCPARKWRGCIQPIGDKYHDDLDPDQCRKVTNVFALSHTVARRVGLMVTIDKRLVLNANH